jgi:uncharacterized protein (DUF2126 family)
LTAYEDVPRLLGEEAALPINADLQSDLRTRPRSCLARLLLSGLDRPAGFVLPLKATPPGRPRREPCLGDEPVAAASRAPVAAVAGDSPLGLRLPLVAAEAAARGRGNRARGRPVLAAPPLPAHRRVESAGASAAPTRAKWSRPR